MRIVYIALLELDIHNAIRTHALEMCASFQKTGNTVTLMAPKPLNEKPEFPFTLSTVRFFGFSFLRLWAFYFFLSVHVKKCLRAEKPDCVYVRELFNPLPPLLLTLLRVPYFVEVNDFILKTPHCKNRFIKSLYFKFCEKIELGCARGIFVPAEGIKTDLVKTYGIESGKIHVVENGANTELFHPMDMQECRKKLNLPADAFILGYVGTFQDYHDLESVLRALPEIKKRIPALLLLLVGEGMGREQPFRALAEKLRVSDCVRFTGQIPYENVPLYINSFDTAFVTFKKSRLEQTLTMKVKEYMACGRPIVITDIPGHPFLKTAAGALRTVPCEDKDAFAEAVSDLHRDSSTRIKMGGEAANLLRSHFRWEHAAARTLSIMEKFLRKNTTNECTV